MWVSMIPIFVCGFLFMVPKPATEGEHVIAGLPKLQPGKYSNMKLDMRPEFEVLKQQEFIRCRNVKHFLGYLKMWSLIVDVCFLYYFSVLLCQFIFLELGDY